MTTKYFKQGVQLPSVFIADGNPNEGNGVPDAPPHAFLIRTDENSLYYFKGPSNKDWAKIQAPFLYPLPYVTTGEIVIYARATGSDISGNGKIDAQELQVNDASTNISCIGKCLVDVSNNLDVNISGNGSVTINADGI